MLKTLSWARKSRFGDQEGLETGLELLWVIVSGNTSIAHTHKTLPDRPRREAMAHRMIPDKTLMWLDLGSIWDSGLCIGQTEEGRL